MTKSRERYVGRYFGGGNTTRVWSWERKQLLRELYPSGVATEDIIRKLVALPGEKNITPGTIRHAVGKMRLRRTPMKEDRGKIIRT